MVTQHAACCSGATSSRIGASLKQRSIRNGQRGLNLHPAGKFAAVVGLPVPNLADCFLAVDDNHGERGTGSAGSMALFEQRGDVGRVDTIKDQQVEAVLRQAYAGAHGVGAQLHFNIESVQDVAQDFHGSFVRAHYKRCESHTCV